MRFLLLILLFLSPASGEKLIPSLSGHRVVITSSFTGTELVLYSLIERDAMTIGRGSGYDVVLVMRGENERVTIKEKERTFGFWLNRNSLTLPPVPSSFAVYASRPLKDIADFEVRKTNFLGLDTVLYPLGKDPSRLALLRIRQEKQLFSENDNAIVFLTPNWFRSRIRIPAFIPTGQYRLDVYLLSGGVIVARSETGFEVVKSGIEAFITKQSQENPWLYGMVTALIALVSGFFGFLIFRKD